MTPAVRSRRILLLALLASVTRPGHAQQRPHTIGFLVPGSDELARKEYDSVTRELRSLGYSKDRLTIILRADSHQSRLYALAGELVRLKVSLIVTVGTNASIAARGATSTIPILFYGVANPLGSGLADSLARPGRNSTGLTNFSGRLLTEKRVALLRQLLPNLTGVAYLWDPVTGERGIGPLINELGDTLGFSTLVVNAGSLQELESAFQAIVDFRSQAVIFQVDTFFEEVRGHIAELLVRNRLPSIFGDRVHVEAGGLMSYSANEDNNARQVAIYAHKILRGARADDIAIQQPTNLEFVISRRTAERLGLKIPPALLLFPGDQIRDCRLRRQARFNDKALDRSSDACARLGELEHHSDALAHCASQSTQHITSSDPLLARLTNVSEAGTLTSTIKADRR